MDSDVWQILVAYPQIYLACHTRHVRGERSGHALTSRENAVLSHLDQNAPIRHATLAKHLGITPGTLSAALEPLVVAGYVRRERREEDRRKVDLFLTKKGAKAVASSSVLEQKRVQRVLARLSADERRRAVEGLALLARASRETTARKSFVLTNE